MFVDVFNLQASYADKSYLREILGYETLGNAGNPSNHTFHIRLHQNGEFFGLYIYLEDMGDDYLDRNGIDEEGSWYKAYDDCRYRLLSVLPDKYEKKIPHRNRQLSRNYQKRNYINRLEHFKFWCTGIHRIQSILSHLW